MTHITQDFDQYDSLIGLIYDAAQGETGWETPLRVLKSIFQANYVTLILKTPKHQNEEELGLMIVVGGTFDNEVAVQYRPYIHQLTPFAGREPDTVFTVADLMTEGEWRNSDYRIHWCAQKDVYHVMSVDITVNNGERLRFRITRPESSDDFSKEDREFCELIVPHLRRALNVNNRLVHNQALRNLYSQAIGKLSIATLIIDRQGNILEQNLFARHILESGDGFKVIAGRLEAYYPSDNKALKKLVKEAFDRAEEPETPGLPLAMSVARPSGEVNLGLVIEMIPRFDMSDHDNNSSAIVYIRDSAGTSQASSDIAKKLFGLTPAETALSLQLANGNSLEESAEALGIRRNTARAHLRSIFSKTGIKRQSDLVRIFLNSVAALGQTAHEELPEEAEA
ncbi:helix-turn-helix transcriptional regulator [Endozoicomonas ascidiicola]|uniref:helix-turn-helix transcriptional regulator n=1 Tax=Endozoicomonas ascidiicola TaxID=1698521 RepID=UPI00082CACD9|nr:helix-turn-helix transcriptional regulator [Endozoicomonas ascidiicola]